MCAYLTKEEGIKSDKVFNEYCRGNHISVKYHPLGSAECQAKPISTESSNTQGANTEEVLSTFELVKDTPKFMSHLGGTLFNVCYNNGFGELHVESGRLANSYYTLPAKGDNGEIRLATNSNPQCIAQFNYKGLKVVFSPNSSACWYLNGEDVTSRIDHTPARFQTGHQAIRVPEGNFRARRRMELIRRGDMNAGPDPAECRNPVDFKSVGSDVFYLDNKKSMRRFDLKMIHDKLVAWKEGDARIATSPVKVTTPQVSAFDVDDRKQIFDIDQGGNTIEHCNTGKSSLILSRN